MTSMKLGLVFAVLVTLFAATASAKQPRTSSPHPQHCSTVYVLGGTITTCK